MPTVNAKVFEESRRQQLVTEYSVTPLNVTDVKDAALAFNTKSSAREDAGFILQRRKINHWAESKGKVWSKMTLRAKTPFSLIVVTGSQSPVNESSGENVFAFFDDFNRPDSSNPGPKWTVMQRKNTGTVSGELRTSSDGLASNNLKAATNQLYGSWQWQHRGAGPLENYVILIDRGTIGWIGGQDVYVAHSSSSPYTQLCILGTYVISDSSVSTTTANHVFRVTRTQDDFWSLYIDGVLKGSGTFAGPADGSAMSIQTNNAGTNYSYTDNVALGAYASPEPVIRIVRTLNRSLMIKYMGGAG